jgi:hypothetical protein
VAANLRKETSRKAEGRKEADEGDRQVNIPQEAFIEVLKTNRPEATGAIRCGTTSGTEASRRCTEAP